MEAGQMTEGQAAAGNERLLLVRCLDGRSDQVPDLSP
jgi:hypothetical protein